MSALQIAKNRKKDLKEFVKTALSDITCAISEMQQTLQNGAVINPAKQRSDYGDNEVLLNGNVCRIERINFDVAVMASERDNGSAKIGVNVIGFKAEVGKDDTQQNVSRITFSIPVILPVMPIKKKD